MARQQRGLSRSWAVGGGSRAPTAALPPHPHPPAVHRPRCCGCAGSRWRLRRVGGGAAAGCRRSCTPSGLALGWGRAVAGGAQAGRWCGALSGPGILNAAVRSAAAAAPQGRALHAIARSPPPAATLCSAVSGALPPPLPCENRMGLFTRMQQTRYMIAGRRRGAALRVAAWHAWRGCAWLRAACCTIAWRGLQDDAGREGGGVPAPCAVAPRPRHAGAQAPRPKRRRRVHAWRHHRREQGAGGGMQATQELALPLAAERRERGLGVWWRSGRKLGMEGSRQVVWKQ